MPVSEDAAAWGMRLLLGYQPDDAMVEFHRNGYDSLEDMRTAFLRTQEAKNLFGSANGLDFSSVGYHRGPGYSIPPFLLRRPAYPDVPWEFSEPTLEHPVSQLCTSEQMATEHYRNLCGELGLDATSPQRKIWEFIYVVSVLRNKGMLTPGRRGLGFGTGLEPLPSYFAKAGVQVTATDAPEDLDFSAAWEKSDQWARGLEDLWHPEIVDRGSFFDSVTFRPADMNNIPAELSGFDFCWSACCFEHLGSIRNGLDFLHNCLDTLRPGGVSVHTTEFNLSSDDKTLEAPVLALFRKRDFEQILHEIVQEGHEVEPLNLWPGAMPVDEHIDLPPYTSTHLKLQLQGFLTTSIGIVVTKKR